MRFKNQFLALLLVLVSQSIWADDNNLNNKKAFKPVLKLFEAMSQIDHKKMKTVVTKDFILLEHGEVWSIDDLANVVKASDYKRTNYFSVVNTQYQGDIAWINYWNKANFSNGKNSQDVVWLESVVVLKQKGHWVISQMHSTRLKAENYPKNVEFKLVN